ncbi:MAG: hypothetical protein DMG21_06940 [Acidobacteria bacterium]|nr:MAG: hypothetical protein DMG21_06940 [Acidobacteriota bacterium]
MKTAAFLDSLKANAGRSRVLLGSALNHLRNGESEAAVGDLRQAADLSPDYPEVHFQLAMALTQQGSRPSEVEAELRHALELKQDFPQAHFQLGLVLESEGKTAMGLSEIRHAADLAPSLLEAHRKLGEAALKSHDWAGAIAEFSAILAFDGTDRSARLELRLAQTRFLQR